MGTWIEVWLGDVLVSQRLLSPSPPHGDDDHLIRELPHELEAEWRSLTMHGLIEASKAPRMNRNTMRPAKLSNAAQIMHEMDHPKKQKVIHRFTGNLTSA
jgi:hypothetical protein